MNEVVWRYEPFERLTAIELYRIVVLRERVFVVEQNCVFLDADGLDPACDHLWTESALISGAARGATPGPRPSDSARPTTASALPQVAAPSVLAYLRVMPAGVKYDEVGIGRVITAPEVRGTGLGQVLMVEGIRRAVERFGAVPIRIGAQQRLERFYASLGFVRASDEYLEDGIPHIEMLRNP